MARWSHMSKYNVVTSSGGVEYGFRCKHIWASRHKTKRERYDAMEKHLRELKRRLDASATV